jgi:tetratricopeptide (TPR) repeat protein
VNPIGSTLQQRYQILEQLGGTGAVTTYLAVDLQVPGNLQLKCAIHCYRLSDPSPGSGCWDRAIESAQMLHKLSRQVDRLPTVYSYFGEGEAFYLVREFVEGSPLAQELLPNRPWTESRLVMLLADLLQVLHDIDNCAAVPDPVSLTQIIRRNLDRKLVLINLPIVTGLPTPAIGGDFTSTQHDLRTVGEIAIAAATGLSGSKLPLTVGHKSHWQKHSPAIHNPELIAILERLITDEPQHQYLSTSAAWQAVVTVMSQLLVHHQTPTDSQVEIAKHVQMLVDRGSGFYGIGDCQQAIVAYDRALALDHRCIEAYCGRGNARRYVGDYPGSWADFDIAVQLDPQQGGAYIGRALANCFQHQPDDLAIADFQYGIELLDRPQTAIDYVMRGTAYAQLSNTEAAIKDYTSAIDLNPRMVVAYNNRGNLRQYLGDLDGAIKDFSIVLEIDVQSPIAYNNRGIVYTYLARYPEAIDDYTKALDLQPNFTSAYNNRANAYCHINEFDKAIADYSQSIAFDPNFAVAYSNRGNIYRTQGDLSAALSDYDRSIKLDSNLTIAHYNRGICHRQLGNHQQAIADYTKTLVLDPQYFYAYYHRGNARQYLGDKHGAIADYTQTLRFDPQHVHTYYNRAVTRSEIGDFQAAIADLEAAIDLDPEFALAHYQLGWLLAKTDNHELALFEYQCAIDLKANYLDAYYQHGISQQILGDRSGAYASFSSCLDIDPKYAPAYYQRGKINIQLGDRAGAIADYHQAAKLYLDRGDSKTYQQILQTIDRIPVI